MAEDKKIKAPADADGMEQIKNIEGAIEAILYAAGYPVKYEKIAEVLGLDLRNTKTLIKHLHRGSREISASADAERLAYIGGVLLLGAELTGVVEGKQSDASLRSLAIVFLAHMLDKRLGIAYVKSQDLGYFFIFYGIACRKEY